MVSINQTILFFLLLCLDVIDWLLDNLINQTRTRRGVLKKLKELGLIFKAPTKRTNAVANKNAWTHEQDDRLRTLYDEHRSNEGIYICRFMCL